MTRDLTKMMTTAAGTGYHNSLKFVYLLELASGVTSAQLMLGGSQISSFQNMLDMLKVSIIGIRVLLGVAFLAHSENK